MDMFFKPSIGIRQESTTVQRPGARAWLRVRRMVFLCLLLPFLAAGTVAEDLQVAAENAGASITVLSEARVAGERILLGQLVEISGVTRELRGKMGAVDLGAAPRPGKERRVPGRLVASTLSSCGFLPAGSHTTIPDWIIVKRACQTLSEASLGGVFKAYLDRRAGGDETAVSRLKVRGLKPLPLGDIALTPLGHGGDYIKGNITLRLAVTVAGEDQGQVSISGWVDRYVQAVCSTRSFQRGTVLTAGDLCLKRINVSKAPDRIVFDLNQVMGKQLRSRVRAGECLKEQMVTEPPLILKGDRVKIMARADRLSVSTMGIAKADGARGDQIRVENPVSEKTVVGRVMDRGVVEVLF
jgi:flagellar basal body P-ring formation protein FlgA